ncbi:MAG: TetR family transcriptional regulator C-terminal domain-containing protein [Deltaproteobacteria bacterium]|nr:TetR family transcriptional regulator C-terminal domain-containing protein [Deltaproteobacteria bacterium]
MNKTDTRWKILQAGAELVHRQGFHHTGLKEILDASGVPKGSFYFYFKSKEDFGLALIDLYVEEIAAVARSCFEDESRSPVARLHAFFLGSYARLEAEGCQKGCPIGNLCQEMSDLSPAFRQKLESATELMIAGITQVLQKARAAGELPDHLDPEETARFITSSWQGAMLTMKVVKSIEPLHRFDRFIFGEILSGPKPDRPA